MSQKDGAHGSANYVELTMTGSSEQPYNSHDSRFDTEEYHSSPFISDQEALHGELDEALPLAKAIKKYPKLVGWCLGLTLAIIGWGYDLVIVGSITTVDSFRNDYGEVHDGKHIIPAQWLSMWLGLPLGGSALGSLLGGWLGDRVGRRYTLMVASTFSAIAIGFIFFSFLPASFNLRRMLFTIGLTVQGFSVGMIKTTCLTYVSENAPTAIRASAMALFPTCTLAGQLIGAVVVFIVNRVPGQTGYLGAFGSQWILTLAPFIVSVFMPESPAHLLRKGKRDVALRATARLFAPHVDPQGVLNSIQATIDEEKKNSASVSFIDTVKGPNLRRTLIVILANALPALFGLDLLSNASYFVETIGLDSSIALLFQIGGIVCGIAGNAGGLWVLARVGRRVATLATLGVAGLLWGGVGISGFWRGETPAYVVAGLMITVIVVCGLGCWPAGFAIMGEASSLRLRAKTQAIGQIGTQASSIVMSVTLPYIFNADAGNLGGKTGFVYTGLCMIGVLLVWLWVPEMKGRSPMEIDHMFAIGLPTRKFKTYQTIGEQDL